MIVDTGFASGGITQSSVGPISKMLYRWFRSQNLSGWPFDVPADLPLESTSELDSLISVGIFDTIQSSPQHGDWAALWKMAVVTRCVCNQLFSVGTIEDLYLSCTRMPVEKGSGPI